MKNNLSYGRSGSGRAEQLQFLRFVAFLNVFIAHGDAWNFFGYPASHSATVAVSFFFSLSGLVTGYSGYGRDISPGVRNIAGDMLRKIRKIYPLYLVTLLVPLLFSPLPGMLADRNWEALGRALGDLGLCLVFAQSWFTRELFNPNGLTWFLSALMFLYLLNLPVLHVLSRVNRSKFRFPLFAGGFCTVILLTALYCRLTQNLYMPYWHYVFPPARMGEYISGMILGYAIRGFRPYVPEGRRTGEFLTLCELAAMGLWVWSLRRAGSPWMNHIIAWIIPNTAVLTAFTFGGGLVSRLLRKRPLVWLGDISFECYLIHQLIIQRYYLLHTPQPVPPLDQAVALGFCLGLTLLLGAVLHRPAASVREGKLPVPGR